MGEINELVKKWMSSSDVVQQEMGKRMKDKCDKYWGTWNENLEVQNDKGKGKGKEKKKENINLLIFVAAILDPRYKLSQYTEMAIEEMYGLQLPNACKSFLKNTGRIILQVMCSPNKVNLLHNLSKVEMMLESLRLS
jgi:hypothetical protein